MKKIVIVVAVVCHLSLWVSSQNRTIDSLIAQLATKQNDTALINTLNALTFELVYASDYPRALEYGAKSLRASEKLNYKRGLANALANIGLTHLNSGKIQAGLDYMLRAAIVQKQRGFLKGLSTAYDHIGVAYQELGDSEKALNYFDSSLVLKKKLGDTLGLAESHMNISSIHFGLGAYNTVKEHQTKALAIFSRLGNKQGMTWVHFNRGGLFYYQGNYSQALQDFYNAFRLSKETGNKPLVAASKNSIGLIYFQQKKFHEARKEYESALKMSRDIGDKIEIATSLHNIGEVYLAESNFEKAEDYLIQALRLRQESGQKLRIAGSYKSLGLVHYEKKQYTSAIEYFNKALNLCKSIKGVAGETECLTHLAQSYLAIGDNRRAAEYIQKALPLSNALDQKDLSSEVYLVHAKIDSAKGDYKSAYANLKLLMEVKDSVFTIEKAKKIDQISTQYEYDRKSDSLLFAKRLSDNKILLQAVTIKSAKNSRNLLVSLSLLLFLFGGILVFKRNQRKKLLYQRQMDLMEIKALKAQMNPHFIFNALNSIYNFVELNKTDIAASYIIKFSRLMRVILKNSMEPSISLKEELEVLQLYVELERDRLSGNFKFEVDVGQGIRPADTQVPALIFQPIVENSLWHGISQNPSAGIIRIEITKQNELLKCSVSDNGVGRTNKEQTINYDRKMLKDSNEKSYGLQLTKERIDVLHKLKKTKNHSTTEPLTIIDLRDKDDISVGTKVVFTLPYELSN